MSWFTPPPTSYGARIQESPRSHRHTKEEREWGSMTFYTQQSCQLIRRDWVVPLKLAWLLQETHQRLWRDWIDMAGQVSAWHAITPRHMVWFFQDSRHMHWHDWKWPDLEINFPMFICRILLKRAKIGKITWLPLTAMSLKMRWALFDENVSCAHGLAVHIN
jgi:hypothetical protein